MRTKLTKELVDELFIIQDYKLYWRNSRGCAAAGNRAGWLDADGYNFIGINGRLFQEHRIIFFYYYGYLPELVDHIDRDTSNNQPDNLRAADKVINSVNRGLQSNNTSGVRGVGFNKNSGKWVAYIKIGGKHIHLGLRDYFEDAACLRKQAELTHWGVNP